MTDTEKLYQDLHLGFPIYPIPERAIRESEYFPRDFDTVPSLESCILGKHWDSVNLNDWAMVGTTPGISRYYLTAQAFHYYIPSILSCVCKTGQYPEFAIDSLAAPDFEEDALLQNELQAWWDLFLKHFSTPQKQCVSSFIKYINSREDIFSSEREALGAIWS